MTIIHGVTTKVAVMMMWIKRLAKRNNLLVEFDIENKTFSFKGKLDDVKRAEDEYNDTWRNGG